MILVRHLLTAGVAAGLLLALVFAGDVRSWGSHTNCANNSGNYSNYAERYVGPHSTHWPQWSSDQPYYARRKDPTDGSLTYNSYVAYGAGPDEHFPTDANRYTGMKNANGVSAFWFASHFTGNGC